VLKEPPNPSADRALAVWTAAWRGKRPMLDNEQALKLAEGLESASAWRRIAGNKNPRPELSILARRARKLAEDLNRAASLYPAAFILRDDINLPMLILGMESIQVIADEPWVPSVLRAAFHSPERLFVKTLGEHYLTHSGKNPKISRSKDGTLSGPFLRFVQEASRQFCPTMPVPSGGVVRRSLEDAKQLPHTNSIATPEQK
jgi:hypothetical protein